MFLKVDIKECEYLFCIQVLWHLGPQGWLWTGAKMGNLPAFFFFLFAARSCLNDLTLDLKYIYYF